MEYLKKDELPRCVECGDPIIYGRVDKKFCSTRCKNSYHNNSLKRYRMMHTHVLNALERNYRILCGLLEQGITSMDLVDLAHLGYNIEFTTSYHKIRGRNEYRCFDIKYCCSDSRIYGIERF